jgi:hypothetical protein
MNKQTSIQQQIMNHRNLSGLEFYQFLQNLRPKLSPPKIKCLMNLLFVPPFFNYKDLILRIAQYLADDQVVHLTETNRSLFQTYQSLRKQRKTAKLKQIQSILQKLFTNINHESLKKLEIIIDNFSSHIFNDSMLYNLFTIKSNDLYDMLYETCLLRIKIARHLIQKGFNPDFRYIPPSVSDYQQLFGSDSGSDSQLNLLNALMKYYEELAVCLENPDEDIVLIELQQLIIEVIRLRVDVNLGGFDCPIRIALRNQSIIDLLPLLFEYGATLEDISDDEYGTLQSRLEVLHPEFLEYCKTLESKAKARLDST